MLISLEGTGRRVAVRFVVVVTIRDGRVTSLHNCHDRLAFLAQLGAIPGTSRLVADPRCTPRRNALSPHRD
jgi:hypothetical protein